MINHRLRKQALHLSNFTQAVLVDAGTDTRLIQAGVFLHYLESIESTTSLLRRIMVEDLREQEFSWDEIGKLLGMTRQSAWEKYRTEV